MRRALAVAALVLLAGAAALAAFAVARREALAGRAARALLASRGVSASFAVAELGWGGARLEDLRVGPPDAPALVAPRVELAWSPAGLRAGRLDRIAAEAVRLEASLDARGLQLRGLGALPDSEAGADRTAGVLALPVATAELRGLELHLETPLGALALSGRGELRRDEDGAPRFALALAAPALEIAGRARLERVELDAEGGLAELRARLRVARISDAREPALVAPLAVEVEVSGPLERLELAGAAWIAPGGIRGELRGVVEPMARRAELELRIPETELAGEAREPARVLPFLAGRIERARGRVGAVGRASLEAGALRASADLALRDLDLRTPDLVLRRLNGVVRFEAPPLRTPPRQLVAVAEIEGALALRDGLVSFELTRRGVVRVESATFALAGGRLRASGELALGAPDRELAVAAEGLDVAAILASLGFEGLSGTGTLEGTLPLRQHGARLSIDGGRLRATAPGVLRYRPGAGGVAVQRDEKLGTVIGALDDLHYDELSLEVSGDTGEELSVKVHARGRNPGYQQGRPVVLNLDVRARLADLVRAGRAAYRVPAEVEERVQRALGPEKR